MEYKLVLDQSVIDEYCAEYFKVHPRAKKKPIERPIQPGLNQMLILRRLQMSSLKKTWLEFGIWWIHKLGYENLKLNKFEIEVTIYMPTRRKFDLDNFGAGNKLLFDSFVESSFIENDDYTHLTKLTISGDYSKEHPRTEFLIKVFED